MASYRVQTKLTLEKAIEKAEAFFGAGGLGLEATEEGAPCCVLFSGGGGYVRVTAHVEGEATFVDLETREWDYQVKQFIRKIA